MTMSGKQEVGIIGQLYEDRKTGKRGVLESRNDKYKTLMLADENGYAFTISNSTFRSNWRKVKDESEPVVEDVYDNADVPATDNTDVSTEDTNSVSEQIVSITDDEAIERFVSRIKPHRNITATNADGTFEIRIDDIVIFRMKSIGDNVFSASMLPDVFSTSTIPDITKPNTFKVVVDDVENLGVHIITKPTSIPEIISIIETTVQDINLYGYIIEDDDSEEN